MTQITLGLLKWASLPQYGAWHQSLGASRLCKRCALICLSAFFIVNVCGTELACLTCKLNLKAIKIPRPFFVLMQEFI